MPQVLSQEQTQEQRLLQQQRITQQQLLNVRLLSMSLAELEQSVLAAIDDNPALERVLDDETEQSYTLSDEAFSDNDNEPSAEQEERQDELTRALEHMESDDESPDERDSYTAQGEGSNDLQYVSAITFRDILLEQMGEEELSERERHIMEYLIGSLDSDGLLRKDISTLVDELAIYEYVTATEEEIESLLHRLQAFDPAGVGAQSLQECLRLQIDRQPVSALRTSMLTVVDRYFDLFLALRWDKIRTAMGLSDAQIATLRQAFRRLNPRPGIAAGESLGRSTQQIIPDVTIYPARADGTILFEVNMGNVPHVAVSDDFTAFLNDYKRDSTKEVSHAEKEALLFARRQVEQASWYVAALRQRQQTIESTMRAIITWQKKYFLSGEESDLRPMALHDIATATGLDISTISRVSNEKYAATPWGIVPLRFFFSYRFRSQEKNILSSRTVKVTLKELIDGEDKTAPYTDDTLVALMAQRGFSLTRRTVSKYRNQMSIPAARLRRQR